MHPQVEQVVTKIDAFIAKYPKVSQYEKLQKLEDQTGYPKAIFFVGITLFIFVTFSLIGGAKLLVDLLGFLYPAYMSFKSMDGAVNDEITQWLTYWIVFSFLNIFESLFSLVVAWIPFYFWIKIGLVIWMWHPKTHGAQTIYEQGLRPVLLPYLEHMGVLEKKTN